MLLFFFKSGKWRDYIWYGQLSATNFDQFLNGTKIKTLYRGWLPHNLDISQHCPIAVNLWRHQNGLIPAILETNENIVILSSYCAFGSKERRSA